MIKELISEEEMRQGFDVMKQLRTHLDLGRYEELMVQMKKEGYRLFAYWEKEQITAVAGVIILTNLYDGRHVYVYDLVTDEGTRSMGYGQQLLTFIEQWGKENHCENVALSSGLQRIDAHRFYENRMGFKKTSYVFKKVIQKP